MNSRIFLCSLSFLSIFPFVLPHDEDLPPPHRPLATYFEEKFGMQDYGPGSSAMSEALPIGEIITTGEPVPDCVSEKKLKHAGALFMDQLKANVTQRFFSRSADCVITLLRGGPLIFHLLNPANKSYMTKTLGIGDDEDFVLTVKSDTLVAVEVRGAIEFPFRYGLCSVITFPQVRLEDTNYPNRIELLSQFPQHEEVITRFTAEES